MNRCLTEGRRAFLGRVAAIRGGEECERLIPLLSAVADGEAGAEELALLPTPANEFAPTTTAQPAATPATTPAPTSSPSPARSSTPAAGGGGGAGEFNP